MFLDFPPTSILLPHIFFACVNVTIPLLPAQPILNSPPLHLAIHLTVLQVPPVVVAQHKHALQADTGTGCSRPIAITSLPMCICVVVRVKVGVNAASVCQRHQSMCVVVSILQPMELPIMPLAAVVIQMIQSFQVNPATALSTFLDKYLVTIFYGKLHSYHFL